MVGEAGPRWIWTVGLASVRPESDPAPADLARTDRGRSPGPAARAAYWQTDANPDLAQVLADLQRQQIQQTGHGLKIGLGGMAAAAALSVLASFLFGGGHLESPDLLWGFFLIPLPLVVFVLPSRWGYQAACAYNEKVLERASEQTRCLGGEWAADNEQVAERAREAGRSPPSEHTG